jgi:NADPH2:quinone reductase
MRAVVYSEHGDPSVLRLVDRPARVPGPGEVRVAVHVSGVNPTDWKSRSGLTVRHSFDEVVPNQDGAGVVDAVGEGVAGLRVGQRVWIWEAQNGRPDGTAQEMVVVPADNVVLLPPVASFELGASLGVPALTAHRCLSVAEAGPSALVPGALAGHRVLVAGGAGAVGNAAIQLARWAGARVAATVSGAEKAELARAAGAEHVVNYRTEDAAAAVREWAPAGVDVIVEVAPAVNAALDAAVLGQGGTIAVYANNGGTSMSLEIRPHMALNARYQFVLLYTVPEAAKRQALLDVSAAVVAGAFRVGAEAGLPLHHYPLERCADAHAAVEQGAVGKVLIDLV